MVPQFQYTAFIQNLCEDSFDEAATLAAYPDTFLVHSKWPYFTEDERRMRQWHWDRVLQVTALRAPH